MIPLLESLLGAAIESKKKLETLQGEMSGLGQRIMMSGGILVDIEKIAGFKQEKESSVEQLRQSLQQIESSGCLIKDLDIGLIDFPCLVDDREIYLCWKLGEPNIRFWHNTDEGFQGRKPLDPSLLDGDGGERPN